MKQLKIVLLLLFFSFSNIYSSLPDLLQQLKILENQLQILNKMLSAIKPPLQPLPPARPVQITPERRKPLVEEPKPVLKPFEEPIVFPAPPDIAPLPPTKPIQLPERPRAITEEPKLELKPFEEPIVSPEPPDIAPLPPTKPVQIPTERIRPVVEPRPILKPFEEPLVSPEAPFPEAEEFEMVPSLIIGEKARLLEESIIIKTFDIELFNNTNHDINLQINSYTLQGQPVIDEIFSLKPNESKKIRLEPNMIITWPGAISTFNITDYIQRVFRDKPHWEGKPLRIKLSEKESYGGFGTQALINIEPLALDDPRVGWLPYWFDITDFKKEEIEKQPYTALNPKQNIRRVLFYKKNQSKPPTKEELNTLPRNVLFILHGTFAQESPEFWEMHNLTMQSIQAFAQTQKDPQTEAVEVVSFAWSGENTNIARQNAGQQLAELIDKNYLDANKYPSFITLAHSHGGNVVNVATHYIQRPINKMIHIFTPARAEGIYIPASKGFEKLYNFYSTGDQVQYLGSLDLTKISWENFLRNVTDWQKEDTYWWNWTWKPYGGRKAPEQLDRVLNFRVQYQGVSPSHVYKEPLINYLPKVFITVERLYKLHYSFDLNIDPNIPNLEGVYLTIRGKNPITDPQEIPLEIKDFPQIQKGKWRTALSKQLEEELFNSSLEAERFQRKYGKPISDKGWRIPDYIQELGHLVKSPIQKFFYPQ